VNAPSWSLSTAGTPTVWPITLAGAASRPATEASPERGISVSPVVIDREGHARPGVQDRVEALVAEPVVGTGEARAAHGFRLADSRHLAHAPDGRRQPSV
jgi:uncharacterized protein GlcG (DUF336 family)